MTANPYDDPRITAIGLFAEAWSGLTTRFASQLDRHGLSMVEFEVLLRLARSAGRWLRMTDLAAQTSLSTSGITRVVDRLERDGLVAREACPTDRRSSHAVLTATGLARLDAAMPGHLQIIEQWFTGQLTAEQLDRLLEGLRRVRDAVHPGATAGADGPQTSHPALAP